MRPPERFGTAQRVFKALRKNQSVRAFVGAGDLLDSFPCVISGITFDEDDLVLRSHHRATDKNIVDVSRFVARWNNNRYGGTLLADRFHWACDHDVEHGEMPEIWRRSRVWYRKSG